MEPRFPTVAVVLFTDARMHEAAILRASPGRHVDERTKSLPPTTHDASKLPALLRLGSGHCVHADCRILPHVPFHISRVLPVLRIFASCAMVPASLWKVQPVFITWLALKRPKGTFVVRTCRYALGCGTAASQQSEWPRAAETTMRAQRAGLRRQESREGNIYNVCALSMPFPFR